MLETSLTGLKGVFWENELREAKVIGWDKIKERQAKEFKFNMGILEPIKLFKQESVLKGNGI